MTSAVHSPFDIAIVGMAGRFPGARNLSAFWRNLRDGVESIAHFSRTDAIAAGVDPGLVEHPNFVRASGVLDDIDLFDAEFFGYSPREAESLDPQQRLFLECCWHALEDAAHRPGVRDDMVGVYAGCGMSSYYFQLYMNPEFVAQNGHFQLLIGNDKDYLATRTSYKLDLRGPSVTVQTACSTSLVAVCFACDALLHQQCDVALAGGVSVRVPQKTGYFYVPDGIYSPDGHCRAFDAKAQGTVFGHGVGVVVLKRLADAIEQRDRIRAVIRGSAVNNDGCLKAGYTAPSVRGQAEVIAMAQNVSDIDPATITYIESHGTGTALGDPIEIEALTQAFRAGTKKRSYCAVGSLKPNVGHLDSAAGVASLIKTVLCLENRYLPPSLHFEQANPRIDFAKTPFFINSKLAPWKHGKEPLRAGVSSFGIGGTNAHLIVEEAPVVDSSRSLRKTQLLFLSAKTDSALEALTLDYAATLQSKTDEHLADLAYTCQVGRQAFQHRRIAVCRTSNETAQRLKASKFLMSGVTSARKRPLVFMLPGQGSQSIFMARDLFDDEPSFHASMERCAKFLAPLLGVNLLDLIYPTGGKDEKEAAASLDQTAYTQPALFAIEYALASLLIDWGLKPDGMIGHSIGEYVAACLSGVFCLEQALTLVAERGRLMQQTVDGSMIAVALSEEDIVPHLTEDTSIACVNAPSQVVLSGSREAIGDLERRLQAKGIDSQYLKTSRAFHSRLMDPMLRPFAEALKNTRLNRAKIPFISNVTGSWISDRSARSPEYWVTQLRSTVRFSSGLQRILQDYPGAILLEVGPEHTLTSLARRYFPEKSGYEALPCLSGRHDQRTDTDILLNAVGQLWISGLPFDSEAFYANERRLKVEVPPYPFARKRYWVDAPTRQSANSNTPRAQTMTDVSKWFYVPSWKLRVTPSPPRVGCSETTWIIFDDAQGLAECVRERLKARRERILSVIPGRSFKRSENAFQIDPGNPEHYRKLFDALKSQGIIPNRILHLWNITPKGKVQDAVESFYRIQELGMYSVLRMCQAIAAGNITEHVQIGVVSNHLHKVRSRDVVIPEKATILGVCNAVPQEYPNLRCRSIDVHLAEGDNAALRGAARDLVAEMSRQGRDAVVAYRGGKRFVQVYDPSPLSRQKGATLFLRDDAVYLITGGLGHLGLTLAEGFAHRVSAKLVLIGRSGLPARSGWSDWTARHGIENAISRKIEKVRAIESLGSQVLVVGADLSQQKEVKRTVDKVIARFGPIHAVIHASGVLDPSAFPTLDKTTPSICERHFGPKVRALQWLERSLRDHRPNYWVLVSSISSVLAGIGYAAYSSANHYLDALAHSQNDGHSSRWVSVNWDEWDFGDGRSGRPDCIRPPQGVEAFHRIVSGKSSCQVVVSTSALQARIDQWINPDLPVQGAQVEEQISDRHERPDLATEYVAPRTKVERTIAGVWQELLGIKNVGVDDNFFTDLNGNSLIATQVVSRLRVILKQEFQLRLFFEYPTVGQFALQIEPTPARIDWRTHEIEAGVHLAVERSTRAPEQRLHRRRAGLAAS